MATTINNWRLEIDATKPSLFRLSGAMADPEEFGRIIPVLTGPLTGNDGRDVYTDQLKENDGRGDFLAPSAYRLGQPSADYTSAQIAEAMVHIGKLPNPRQALQAAREGLRVFTISEARLVTQPGRGYALAGLMPGHPLDPKGQANIQSSTLVAYDEARAAFVTRSGSRYSPDAFSTSGTELASMRDLARQLPVVGERTPNRESKEVVHLGSLELAGQAL